MVANKAIHRGNIDGPPAQPAPEVLGGKHVLMQCTGAMAAIDKMGDIPLKNGSEGIGNNAGPDGRTLPAP